MLVGCRAILSPDSRRPSKERAKITMQESADGRGMQGLGCMQHVDSGIGDLEALQLSAFVGGLRCL